MRNLLKYFCRCPENYYEAIPTSDECSFFDNSRLNGALKPEKVIKKFPFFRKDRSTNSCNGDLSTLETDYENVAVGVTCILTHVQK